MINPNITGAFTMIIVSMVTQSVLRVFDSDKHGLSLFITNYKEGIISHAIDIKSTATIQDLIDIIADTFNINDKDILIKPKYSGLDLLENNNKDCLLSDLGICAETNIEFEIIEAIKLKLNFTYYNQNLNGQVMFSSLSEIKYEIDPLTYWDKEAYSDYWNVNDYKKQIVMQQYGH